MLVALLSLIPATGCTSTQQSTDASTPTPSVDCTLARTAMDDYSIALTDLATSLEAGDAMSAVAAADAMSYALDQLETALPGIPPGGDAFLEASRAVALKVKTSAAASSEMTGLVGELTQSFADPAFAEGGDTIDAYADEVCPEASPSAS